MKELTDKQMQVLSFIRNYSNENACPPTVREVANFFGVSLKAAQDHIAALRKKNCLSPSEKKSRSLKVLVNMGDTDTLPQTASAVAVPLLGAVAAGKPILCEENFEGNIAVAKNLIKNGRKYFALRIHGTSMINAGILDGDMAVIEYCETAENGQIVVALIDDSVTLKRFFREPTRIRLQAENPDFNPIYCQDIRILGKLSAIVRSY